MSKILTSIFYLSLKLPRCIWTSTFYFLYFTKKKFIYVRTITYIQDLVFFWGNFWSNTRNIIIIVFNFCSSLSSLLDPVIDPRDPKVELLRSYWLCWVRRRDPELKEETLRKDPTYSGYDLGFRLRGYHVDRDKVGENNMRESIRRVFECSVRVSLLL